MGSVPGRGMAGATVLCRSKLSEFQESGRKEYGWSQGKYKWGDRVLPAAVSCCMRWKWPKGFEMRRASLLFSGKYGLVTGEDVHLGSFLKKQMLVAQSCLTLCNPMDYSLPGSSVLGILQARILEWVAMPSSRGSSQSSDWTCIFCGSCVAGWFFTAEPLGKHTKPSTAQGYLRTQWELSEEKRIKHLSQCQAYYTCVCAQSLSHVDSLRPHGL